MKIKLLASTIMGFESILAQELRDLGVQDINVQNTKVEFSGDFNTLCKANLWLRTAGRVYMKVAEFKATSFDDLFEKTKLISWNTWIGKNDQFPISTISSRHSDLFSKSDCQAIIKKAIATQLQTAYNARQLPETGALFSIRVIIEHDIVTLCIDSSGEGLHKRGYRAHMSQAPLRETLAAGLILLSKWKSERDVLMDPFCGTGTILIEAGLIAKRVAPGLNRQFASDKWAFIPKKIWQQARQEAQDQIDTEATFRIFGSDNNPRVLDIAKKNISIAGLSDIHVQKRDISEISSRFEFGKLICNPPYGERLENQAEVEPLYQDMGKIFKQQFSQWSYYILTPNEEFPVLFKQKPSKKRKLFNGGLQCWYYQYFSAFKPRFKSKQL